MYSDGGHFILEMPPLDVSRQSVFNFFENAIRPDVSTLIEICILRMHQLACPQCKIANANTQAKKLDIVFNTMRIHGMISKGARRDCKKPRDME